MANTPERPTTSRDASAHATTLLKSISEGVRTIFTVTERLNDLRAENLELHADLKRLIENVSRIAGRLDGFDQRFADVDKRIELVVKLAVRDEFDRLRKESPDPKRQTSKPAARRARQPS